jgi:hypothetical protein
MQPIRSLFTSLVLLSTIAAQSDGMPVDPITQIRRVYTDLLAQREKDDKEIDAVVEKAKAAASEDRVALMKKADKMRRDAKKATEEFFAAFKRVDWKKLDQEEDAPLLREGLTDAISDYSDPERAVLACRTFLSSFPDDGATIYLRSKFLPVALIVCDQPDEAVKTLREALPAMRDHEPPINQSHITNTMMLLGDLLSVRGDVEGAKKIFEEMEKSGDRAGADWGALRLKAVGQPAPEIASEQWVGGDARTLESLKGKVVMLGFFASHSSSMIRPSPQSEVHAPPPSAPGSTSCRCRRRPCLPAPKAHCP